MKKFLLLIVCCLGLFACERRPIENPDDYVGIIIDFGTPVESGYETTEDAIYSWLIINDVTYNAVCSNIEPAETPALEEPAFITLSWILCIVTQNPESVELLDERTVDGITYQKYKMILPVNYEGYEFGLYYIEERAYVVVNNKKYYFPKPEVLTDVAYNKTTFKERVVIEDKTYERYLIDIGIDITSGQKTVLGETSFTAFSEKTN